MSQCEFHSEEENQAACGEPAMLVQGVRMTLCITHWYEEEQAMLADHEAFEEEMAELDPLPKGAPDGGSDYEWMMTKPEWLDGGDG